MPLPTCVWADWLSYFDDLCRLAGSGTVPARRFRAFAGDAPFGHTD
jgi:hypothetical protein